jgi:hypothetical protein
VKVRFVFLLLLVSITQAQTSITPTEQEQAKLGKLKAQNETIVQQLAQIDTQIQALNILKQLTSEHQQQKYSEYLGYANTIKTNHKEWGDTNKITFSPQQGEYGTFTKTEEKKPEVKK